MKKSDNYQWINQLKKGTIELCVLIILKKGDSYGYEIVTHLKRFPKFSISHAAIYPILKRLLNKDFISYYWKETEGKPARKYYKITKKGEDFLDIMLEEFKDLYTSVLCLEKELQL